MSPAYRARKYSAEPRAAEYFSREWLQAPDGPLLKFMRRAFLDKKEQDQANLKKRSQPIGLRARHGRESENATVIDLMKRLSLETVVSRSRVSRTQIPCLGSGGLWCYIEMREISLIGAP